MVLLWVERPTTYTQCSGFLPDRRLFLPLVTEGEIIYDITKRHKHVTVAPVNVVNKRADGLRLSKHTATDLSFQWTSTRPLISAFLIIHSQVISPTGKFRCLTKHCFHFKSRFCELVGIKRSVIDCLSQKRNISAEK